MNPEVASLIVRALAECSEDGPWPYTNDGAVITEAVAVYRVTRHRAGLTDHDLWSCRMLNDGQHPPCRRCAHRVGHGAVVYPDGSGRVARCTCGWSGPVRRDGHAAAGDAVEHCEYAVAQ